MWGIWMYELAGDLSNEAKIVSTLSDTLAKKATTTIDMRTASLWSYLRESAGDYRSNLHMSEVRVYEYVARLRDQAGPTAAKLFVESLNFFNPLLGFLKFEVSDVLSPTVKGVAHQAELTKRSRQRGHSGTEAEPVGGALIGQGRPPEKQVLLQIDERKKMSSDKELRKQAMEFLATNVRVKIMATFTEPLEVTAATGESSNSTELAVYSIGL